jgi:CBS domain-containing protein
MVTRPTVHPPSTSVAELRSFFGDEHVQMALLVDRGRLLGTVERGDLSSAVSGDQPATTVAKLEERTGGPDAPLPAAFDAMTRQGRRRLAVTGDDLMLLGLLCLKAGGNGFCSDADVRQRRC